MERTYYTPNYTVIISGGVASIRETRTEQIIIKSTDVSSMILKAKKLNLGMGFDGWTPNFFV